MKTTEKSSLRIFLSTPKGYILAVLVVLMMVGVVLSKDYGALINVGVSIIFAMLTDLLFGLVQKRKRIFPDGAAVTGLIVALVLSSAFPWYLTALTAEIAILSKYLLKINKKPVFNPAAFGLFIAIFLFSSGQSWWGGLSTLPAWCIVFVLIGGFLITQRVNKFPQVFAFLGIYFTLLLILGLLHNKNAGDALRIPFINAALFLAFFMVTDPPTSPAKYKGQVIFGGITAIVSVIVYAEFGNLAFLLIGLLIANGWNAVMVWKNNRAKRQIKQKPPSNPNDRPSGLYAPSSIRHTESSRRYPTHTGIQSSRSRRYSKPSG